METLVLLVQCVSLLLSFLAAFLLLAAAPYAFGRYVGRKEGQSAVVDRAIRDEQEFSMWLNNQKIEENRRAIGRLNSRLT